MPTVLNRVTLVIMEIKNCFSESIRIVRQIQLYSFSGYTLFISREENRTRQIEEKIYAIDSEQTNIWHIHRHEKFLWMA